MTTQCEMTGIGDKNALIKVFIANRPNYTFKNNNEGVYPLSQNEIYDCGQACGNGWRKVFNVYAKFIYALSPVQLNTKDFSSWQDYRDRALLQDNSLASLLYSPPRFDLETDEDTQNSIRIVMGKTYAKSLALPKSLTWVNHEFAIDKKNKLIVCPYFDYRQLSNIKILQLIDHTRELVLPKTL